MLVSPTHSQNVHYQADPSPPGLTSKSIKDPAQVPLPGQSNIKRSNTSAAQLANTEVGQGSVALRRSHNTGYYSFRDYSPVYGTATLGRGATAYK